MQRSSFSFSEARLAFAAIAGVCVPTVLYAGFWLVRSGGWFGMNALYDLVLAGLIAAFIAVAGWFGSIKAAVVKADARHRARRLLAGSAVFFFAMIMLRTGSPHTPMGVGLLFGRGALPQVSGLAGCICVLIGLRRRAEFAHARWLTAGIVLFAISVLSGAQILDQLFGEEILDRRAKAMPRPIGPFTPHWETVPAAAAAGAAALVAAWSEVLLALVRRGREPNAADSAVAVETVTSEHA